MNMARVPHTPEMLRPHVAGKKGIGERAKKTQLEFRVTIVEFAEKEQEHWMDSFLELPHHMQDDLRLVSASLMKMQHEGLIRQLFEVTIQHGGDGCENILNLSYGTMEEVKSMARRRAPAHTGMYFATAPITRIVDCTIKDCFILGVQMAFCDLPEERLDYYFGACSNICSREGQLWIVSRLLDERSVL
jgi:hypothetical protein